MQRSTKIRIWLLLRKAIISYLSLSLRTADESQYIYVWNFSKNGIPAAYLGKKKKSASSNAPNFSFHEHSCYIYIFNIEKITRCFTYIPNLILNSENDFFSYISFLILNFVTSTIFWNPPILSHFPYSMLKLTRNKKNSSSSILRMGRNSIAYSQNQY